MFPLFCLILTLLAVWHREVVAENPKIRAFFLKVYTETPFQTKIAVFNPFWMLLVIFYGLWVSPIG
jgi:hypothetical protein